MGWLCKDWGVPQMAMPVLPFLCVIALTGIWGNQDLEYRVWVSVAEQLMTIAYENGVNLFDTAEVYAAGKAEVILGNIIKKKGWSLVNGPLTVTIVTDALNSSLNCTFKYCPDPNQSKISASHEIVRAMTYVINQGMAMYWGTSRWTAMEIMEAYSVARQFNMIPPVCEQAEYHLFQREKVEVQLPELYHKIGKSESHLACVGAMTWSPLACGIITGKYENGVPETSRASIKSYQWLKDKIVCDDGRKQQAKLKELSLIAERLGCTLPQLAVDSSIALDVFQVLPKMTSHIVGDIDHILGNKPYTKKDYRS
ncbi:UNVERIFIED_CONTAM: hypothetical protein FKN15_046067 [Acipenser sinensis]